MYGEYIEHSIPAHTISRYISRWQSVDPTGAKSEPRHSISRSTATADSRPLSSTGCARLEGSSQFIPWLFGDAPMDDWRLQIRSADVHDAGYRIAVIGRSSFGANGHVEDAVICVRISNCVCRNPTFQVARFIACPAVQVPSGANLSCKVGGGRIGEHALSKRRFATRR